MLSQQGRTVLLYWHLYCLERVFWVCWDRSQQLSWLCRALAAFSVLQCCTPVPSGFSQGDDERAPIHFWVGRDPAESSLHPFALAQSCWDFSLWWSVGMKRREKSELQEHCCCRQVICNLMGLTGGCIFEVMISHSNNKLKEFMTRLFELKISWWKICLLFII